MSSEFFSAPLASGDAEVSAILDAELRRQSDEIQLIASENIVSRAVREAQGGVLTNKYAEGYPGRRYYGGCRHADEIERLAISRATRLFGCGFANVQPHSGAQANQAAFMAMMSPGDCFLGMDLSAGGHLSHGAKPNLSGKWFSPVSYGVRLQDGLIDMESVAETARTHRPKVIIAGGSAYSRIPDFAAFREISDEVGAYLMVDMAHFAGLVATGEVSSPFPHAHVVTTTTHKTLRGPRGGMILTDDESLAKKIDSAVFPGTQGGPLMHVIAAKAAAFGEALSPSFKEYISLVARNARVLSETLASGGCEIVSGGTDTHLALVDLRPFGLSGSSAEESLGRADITCNKNGVPNDPLPPRLTSGIRLGSPACTTRGFGEEEFRLTGEMILRVLRGMSESGGEFSSSVEAEVREEASSLTSRFPLYAS